MTINSHKVVSKQKWLAARKELLVKEKEFSRLRDELSRRRHDLPWEEVEKEYVFDGPEGEETLADLFNDRSQLNYLKGVQIKALWSQQDKE